MYLRMLHRMSKLSCISRSSLLNLLAKRFADHVIDTVDTNSNPASLRSTNLDPMTGVQTY